MSDAFDDVIIGSGQAGTPLASALADAGRRVALVERAHVGGTCVNVGCTPTKTMVASARAAHVVRRAGAYGVRVGEPEVDMPAVRRRARDVVEGFRSSNEKGLLENERIELIVGEARFTAPRTLAVRLDGGGERTLAGERVFLNTGARPSVPPLDGLGDVPFLDSSAHAWSSRRFPNTSWCSAAATSGVEFGQMFRRFGSRVTLVQRGPHLLPREDEDVATALEEILAARRHRPALGLRRDRGVRARGAAAARAARARRRGRRRGDAPAGGRRQDAQHRGARAGRGAAWRSTVRGTWS